MKRYHLYIIIRLEVESTLSLFGAVQELEQNADYSIGSTENVKVIETQIMETNIKYT
jgi:hypothetical protein